MRVSWSANAPNGLLKICAHWERGVFDFITASVMFLNVLQSNTRANLVASDLTGEDTLAPVESLCVL